jgi:hypothetical protein
MINIYFKDISLSDETQKKKIFLFIEWVQTMILCLLESLETIKFLKDENKQLLSKIDDLNKKYITFIDEEKDEVKVQKKEISLEELQDYVKKGLYFDLPLDDDEVQENDFITLDF